MTRRRRRLYFIVSSLTMLGVATTHWHSTPFGRISSSFTVPAKSSAKGSPRNAASGWAGWSKRTAWPGGDDGVTISFRVTDTAASVPVRYRGLLPDLFREGQGVVADGSLDRDGTFVATEILARHDETYMPPEVAAALKKAGRWQGE